MDLTREEIAKKHGVETGEPLEWERVRLAMREFADQEARAFASWIANQVIAGRTYRKLWLDYEAEVLTGNEDRY